MDRNEIHKESCKEFVEFVNTMYVEFVDSGLADEKAFEIVKAFVSSMGGYVYADMYNRNAKKSRRVSYSELSRFRKEEEQHD